MVFYIHVGNPYYTPGLYYADVSGHQATLSRKVTHHLVKLPEAVRFFNLQVIVFLLILTLVIEVDIRAQIRHTRFSRKIKT